MDLKTGEESLLVSKPDHQRAYGIWGKEVLYLDLSSDLRSIHVINIKSKVDEEIVSGEYIHPGTTNDKSILYIDGPDYSMYGGDLYHLDRITGEIKFIAHNAYSPKIWGDKVVWSEPRRQGYKYVQRL